MAREAGEAQEKDAENFNLIPSCIEDAVQRDISILSHDHMAVVYIDIMCDAVCVMTRTGVFFTTRESVLPKFSCRCIPTLSSRDSVPVGGVCNLLQWTDERFSIARVASFSSMSVISRHLQINHNPLVFLCAKSKTKISAFSQLCHELQHATLVGHLTPPSAPYSSTFNSLSPPYLRSFY